MKKIEQLTDEQISRMAEYRDKWIQIGLSTEPACREKAEAAINQMYVHAGLKPPRKIVWCGSPLSQGMTRAIIMDKRLMASVRASVRASVGDSVGASVRASVGDSVLASVGASVGESVGASVWDSVGDSVLASVGASVGDSVWDSAWDSAWDSGYGQHDANWLGLYEYFRDVAGLTSQTEKLSGFIEQAKHAGWYLPHEHICWVSERHHILRRDDRGRLHSEIGPAVMYPDGWAIYAWHGTRVPESVIEQPETITAQSIMQEQNAEVRRVMIERYGLDRFILNSGAKTLDEQGTYSLVSLSDEDFGAITALKMVCPSTGAAYVHPVHPDCTTVDSALAWKRGDDYLDKRFIRHGDVYLIDVNGSSTGTQAYRDNLIWES